MRHADLLAQSLSLRLARRFIPALLRSSPRLASFIRRRLRRSAAVRRVHTVATASYSASGWRSCCRSLCPRSRLLQRIHSPSFTDSPGLSLSLSLFLSPASFESPSFLPCFLACLLASFLAPRFPLPASWLRFFRSTLRFFTSLLYFASLGRCCSGPSHPLFLGSPSIHPSILPSIRARACLLPSSFIVCSLLGFFPPSSPPPSASSSSSSSSSFFFGLSVVGRKLSE